MNQLCDNEALHKIKFLNYSIFNWHKPLLVACLVNLLTYLLSYLITCLLTYLVTYLLTYLLTD